jgi:hypothetical protein
VRHALKKLLVRLAESEVLNLDTEMTVLRQALEVDELD